MLVAITSMDTTERASARPPRLPVPGPGDAENPYPRYRALREGAPLWRGGTGEWVVPRHDEVRRLLAEPALGSAFPPEYHRFTLGDGPAASFLQRIVLHQDRPHHGRLRRLMVRAFSVSAVDRFRPRLEAMVDGMLAAPLARGTLEMVDDVAFPLPVSVICELVGIPATDRDLVRPYAYDLGRAFTTSAGPEQRAVADRAVTFLRDYVGALVRERRTRPGDDLLSSMIAAEDGGDRLGHDEIVDNVVFLFFAGFETTSSLLTTAVQALSTRPDQAELLRADPDRIPAAVEEFLRWDAPIQSRLRFVRERIEIAGQVVRPGRTVLLLLGAANHDPAVFDAPGTLDLGRSPNPHVSFGGGGHLCLGAALARMETAVVLARLLGAARLEPDGPALRHTDGAFRTYATVPLGLHDPIARGAA